MGQHWIRDINPVKGKKMWRRVACVMTALCAGLVTCVAMYALATGPASALSPEDSTEAKHKDGQSRKNNDELLFSYKRDVERRIKRDWYPPKDGRAVTLQFTMGEDGAVSQIRILRSSGAAASDNAAIKAIQTASPFRKPPTEIAGSLSVVCKFGVDWKHLVSVCMHFPMLDKLQGDGDKAVLEKRYTVAVDTYKRLNRIAGVDCVDSKRLVQALVGAASTLKGNSTEARKLLYMALSVNNDCSAAREQLDRIIRGMGKNPQSFQDRLALARQAKSGGDFDLAIGEYKEAERLQHNDLAQVELSDFKRQ